MPTTEYDIVDSVSRENAAYIDGADALAFGEDRAYILEVRDDG
jgi:hypothetical protein